LSDSVLFALVFQIVSV